MVLAKIKENSTYIVTGCVLALMLVLFIMGRCTLETIVIFAVMAGIYIFCEKSGKGKRVLNYLPMIMIAYGCWVYNDMMAIGKCTFSFNKVTFLNFLIYFSVFVIFTGIIKKQIIAWSIPGVVFFILGLVNGIIKAIRSTPLSAGDFFSIKTAMTVAGSYEMKFDTDFIFKTGLAVCLLFGICFVAVRIYQKTRLQQKYTVKERAVMAASGGIFWLILVFTAWIVQFSGVKADYWTHEVNGFGLNLYLQMKEMAGGEPEGYDAQARESMQEKYAGESTGELEETEYPNIIVVMNESFSDLSVLGDFETNKDPLPFYHSLQENTIKGNLFVSIYGGNTANSEYEFLTGNSMQYFSERVVPYQMYLHEEKDNLISQMNQLGYHTVFMHPFGSYGWNRTSVYSYFGTEEMYFEEDMDSLEHIREYATDASQYQFVLDKLQEDRNGKPLFFFNVTVQNHGGYTGEIAELEKEIELTGQSYEGVQNYLNLAYESDRALEEFLTSLETYEEPVAVLFFGDHQPAVEEGFIAETVGSTRTDMTLEERQRLYMTPFFLWANYDIEEKEIAYMSANYLSSFLLEELKLPKTAYQSYLWDLYQEYPVINSVGIIDKEGNYLSYQDLSLETQEVLYEYNSLMYDYMFRSHSETDAFRLKREE